MRGFNKLLGSAIKYLYIPTLVIAGGINLMEGKYLLALYQLLLLLVFFTTQIVVSYQDRFIAESVKEIKHSYEFCLKVLNQWTAESEAMDIVLKNLEKDKKIRGTKYRKQFTDISKQKLEELEKEQLERITKWGNKGGVK